MNNRICGSYIPANGINGESLAKIDFNKITHVFLAFSTLKADESGMFVPAVNGAMINAVELIKNAIAESKAQTKVLISIGGAGASGFCEASRTERGRTAFAEKCRQFIDEYRLDGIDMDWEFPGLAHEGVSACESCVTDFILLLRAIRSAIGDKLLTAAVGSDHWNRVDNSALNELLDLVNVMTYDMNNTSHSAFSLTAAAMNGWLTHGIDREKLVLGVPFYARCTNEKYEWTGYDRLMKLVADKNARLLSTDDQDYIIIGEDKLSIDTPESIKKKSAFIKENGFAGIFNWQELSDYNGELRNAMYEYIFKA
ncbi:MAG: hypothetical protein GX051_09525 [Clostridiales bacterium]|nr:hypothetical protein [Clostridiales bacterium]